MSAAAGPAATTHGMRRSRARRHGAAFVGGRQEPCHPAASSCGPATGPGPSPFAAPVAPSTHSYQGTPKNRGTGAAQQGHAIFDRGNSLKMWERQERLCAVPSTKRPCKALFVVSSGAQTRQHGALSAGLRRRVQPQPARRMRHSSAPSRSYAPLWYYAYSTRRCRNQPIRAAAALRPAYRACAAPASCRLARGRMSSTSIRPAR